jgi:hypothetical protein
MVAQAPELLSDSAPSIHKRADALRSIFKLKPVCAQRLVAAYPSALFMSPRIMNNKLKVLMAIMHKDARIIGRVVVCKTPQLLRRNLEHVRICYQLLPLLLQRSEGFVFGMAAHNGRLLLAPAAKLLVRGARLQAALQLVPAWQQQWQSLRPPQAEEGFAANYSRFERLEFLVATQQAGSIALLDALLLPGAAFEQQFAGWSSWWELKTQRVQQQQQWQAQQQQQQQQGRQQQGQQARQRWQLHMKQAAGPQLHPGPQQQQQLQLQYQQLVHQHLRHMQHRHRQRQLQLQQHRALVLQQRALQWQQQQRQQQQRQRQQQLQQQHQQQLELGSVTTLQTLLQHQQQHLQQQLPAGAGYLWGRYVQPAQQQQQQQQQPAFEQEYQQSLQQQQHQHQHQQLGTLYSHLEEQQQQQQQLERAEAPTYVPAAEVGASDSSGSSSDSSLVQQHTQSAVSDVAAGSEAALLEVVALPDALQQEQQQQQHHNSGMQCEGPASSQDSFVQPQQRQQRMVNLSNGNGNGARYLRRKAVLQQQPAPLQQGQQLWQPAAAAVGFDTL